MTPYQKRVTPFTKRMTEDMQLRYMSPRTIDAYTYHVDRFALRVGKHPEDLGPEQVREFQLWMIDDLKVSWSQFNQAVCALRFFYSVTCQRDWVVHQVPYGKRPQKLPVVLSGDEVARIIACAGVTQLLERASSQQLPVSGFDRRYSAEHGGYSESLPSGDGWNISRTFILPCQVMVRAWTVCSGSSAV